MKNSYALVVLLFFFCFDVQGQTTFDKSYNVGGGIMQCITKTLDDNYMLSGTDGNTTSCRWVLVKIDSLGNVLSKWKYNFGGYWGFSCRVQQAPDSGYFVYGHGDVPPNQSYGRVMKVDKNGNFLWAKHFTNINATPIYAGLALATGEFLSGLGGSGTGAGFGVTKFSATGSVIWSKRNTSHTNNVTREIIRSSDGNYVVAGCIYSGSTPWATVMKLDTAGNVLWSKTINGFQYYNAYNICQTTDGGYAVAVFGNSASHIVKLDASGNYIWSMYSPIMNGFEFVNDIAALPNNRIVIMGKKDNDNYLHLFEINATGTSHTEKRISDIANTPDYMEGGCFVTNADGSLPQGAVMCGWPANFALFEVVRMKADFTGCSVVSLGSPPVDPSSAGTIAGPALTAFTPPLASASAPVVTSPVVNTATYCSMAPMSVSATSTNLLCNAQCNGTASVAVTGGQSPFSYLWSNSQTSAIATGLCAGSYTVTVTDSSGVTASATVTITQPPALTVSASATLSSLCTGNCTGLSSNTAGGTPGYTYLWMPGNITTATVNVCPVNTTNYTCTVTDANNCPQSATVTITVNSLPPVTTSGNTSVCIGSSASLSANGASSYTWQPGNMNGNSIIVTPPATTTYTVTGTAINGCINTATTTVTVNNLPPVTAGSNTNICNGSPAIIAANGASSYTWQPGNMNGNSIIVTPPATTTYTVTGTDANGCTDTATTTVTVNPLPAVTYTQLVTTMCSNWSAQMLTPGSPAGGIYSGTAVTGNSFDPAAAGQGTFTIVYTYTDSNGCSDADSSLISVDLCTGINKQSTGNDIVVYPNPFQAGITVTGIPQQFSVIALYTVFGELVYKTQPQVSQATLDLRELSRGIYFLQVTTGDKTITKKILKH